MWKIKKGDLVKVIKGRARNQYAKLGEKFAEEPGVGKVIKVSHKKNRVWVEGLNLVYKHKRPDQNNPKGRIIQIEAPIHISNIMLICPKCGKPTRVGIKVLEDGTKHRYCKKCGELID